MVIGIVGAEEAKFTDKGFIRAQTLLVSLISDPEVTKVVSGGCHLGGIDIWAIEQAKTLGKNFKEFKPEKHSWEFYKRRNLQIAAASDVVHCITVDVLPKDFQGMRFDFCYHCKLRDHVKSGGCWTMKQARKGVLHIVKNYD